MMNLDFYRISKNSIRSNEELLIVHTKNFGVFERHGVLKTLFFIQNGEIIRSNLIHFSNNNAPHDKLILSFYKNGIGRKAYNGKISLYSIFQNILFFNEMKDGQLIANGTINGKWKKGDGRTASGCTDWYLVTTYYYTGGGTHTTAEFLFQTCDDGECQTTRMGRIKCNGSGGPGGSSNGPVFPPSPNHGDVYEFKDADGKTTVYVWDASMNSWITSLIILPEITVESNPTSYPYLLTDGPMDNMLLTSSENDLYMYDAWSGNWLGGSDAPVVGGPDPHAIPIANVPNHVKCFTANSFATVTIYVDQPYHNSAVPTREGSAGHAWIGIQQGSYTRSIGFYPRGEVNPFTHKDDTGQLKDNAGKEWDVSVSFTVSGDEFSALLDFIQNMTPSIYHLDDYNCTNWVVDAFEGMGIQLPQNTVYWVAGSGLCPAQLGQDLRNLNISGRSYTVSNWWESGNTPANGGTCP